MEARGGGGQGLAAALHSGGGGGGGGQRRRRRRRRRRGRRPVLQPSTIRGHLQLSSAAPKPHTALLPVLLLQPSACFSIIEVRAVRSCSDLLTIRVSHFVMEGKGPCIIPLSFIRFARHVTIYVLISLDV